VDAQANVDAKLVCVDDTRKLLCRSLATDGFPEKVFVLSEQHPPERRGRSKNSESSSSAAPSV